MREAFVVIDFETTSRDPKDAHVVEWAAVVIEAPWFGKENPPIVHTGLVKPPISIPAEVSAVHHIIGADVAGAPAWEEAVNKLLGLFSTGSIAVAHNAEYERTILERAAVVPGLRWICTYKAALRVWPDAPGHSNETLRYWLRLQALGFELGRLGAPRSHSAAHDAIVTHLLLEKLLEAGTSIEDMIKWTNEPAMLPACPLGDWRGHKWAEVEESFLFWIIRKIQDRPDVVFCAQAELDRRAKEREEIRQASAA